jgi:hypothetical protein
MDVACMHAMLPTGDVHSPVQLCFSLDRVTCAMRVIMCVVDGGGCVSRDDHEGVREVTW